MNLALGSGLWEHCKISGKSKWILRNRLWISPLLQKLAILNPDVEMDTDIDNYKIVLNRNEEEEPLNELGFYNVLDTYINVFLPKYKSA
ncbi:hypothetical protein [Mycoplasmopsis bovis]|uniref:hypothetical protein n=1 Tax=Mycoplasmopsis bovis TaxID=28903 RepID=UPI00249D91B7|nr:hypothetical protein [Mycoplasmopsis bovis]